MKDSGEVVGVGGRCLVDGPVQKLGDVEAGALRAAELRDEGAVGGGGLECGLVGWVEAGGADGGLVARLGVELAEVFVDGDEAVEAGGVVEFLAHDFVGGLFDAGVVEDGFEDVLHGLFGVGFVEV